MRGVGPLVARIALRVAWFLLHTWLGFMVEGQVGQQATFFAACRQEAINPLLQFLPPTAIDELPTSRALPVTHPNIALFQVQPPV